jgi:predicted MPP superfamily phosphohydrolase
MRNPLLYLLPDTGKRNTSTPQLPWPQLKERFGEAGWLDLTNGFGSLTVRDTRIAFVGVDDPHLAYDDLDRVAGPADPTADLRLAVAHAPYLRVLDQFTADGYDAIIAGHTHGGQVCLPGGRALTTNCDLEPARARGLHRHPAGSAPGDDGSSWLHVSAGLGTNPYVRFRVACRPEATLLTLVPAV